MLSCFTWMYDVDECGLMWRDTVSKVECIGKCKLIDSQADYHNLSNCKASWHSHSQSQVIIRQEKPPPTPSSGDKISVGYRYNNMHVHIIFHHRSHFTTTHSAAMVIIMMKNKKMNKLYDKIFSHIIMFFSQVARVLLLPGFCFYGWCGSEDDWEIRVAYFTVYFFFFEEVE